jgi:uncharacterized protein (TIGR03066 family)
MKAFAFLAVGVALCALTLEVRAEEKKADNAKLLLGTWEVAKADKGTLPVGSTVEYLKDGKMKIKIKIDDNEQTLDGTYTVEGDKLTLMVTFNNDVKKTTHTIKKISETDLTTADDMGKSVEFKKKK